MRTPNGRVTAPNGVISIEPIRRTVRATLGGETVVDTPDGIRLLEKDHEPVYYFPLADIPAQFLRSSQTHSVCPRKGQADYFDLVVGDDVLPDAVWTYPEHYDDALDLAGYVSIYWDRMDAWYEDGRQISAPSNA
ncbi:DUF427 domain-containing protein [Flexivirga oryzae]|uniref:Uncharacterized protein (DUF427 family) n=1 Tax=Flexivirga oryzae TaxID=1794944 RepID=A0A839N3L7_9MICO|nr:uncharacterized protein (DUF427 family) [Flexivirga oryzae]